MPRDIVIVDYGAGNVRSIQNALAHVAAPDQRVHLTADPATILQANRLILPGVGAFAGCRRKMEQAGVIASIEAAVQQGTPFLGVCVGMQILADEGLEFGRTPGFGWVPGVTRRIELPEDDAVRRTLPHIGWAPLQEAHHPLFEGIPKDAYFYFVHSYFLDCANPADVAARVTYGSTFTAAVVRGNIFGCQFHPEKSDRPGLALLANFCQWSP